MALAERISESVRSWYRPGMMKWHYEHGLVIMAALRLSEDRKDPSLSEWARSMYDPMIADNGDISTFRKGEFNLDQINPGRNLLSLYRLYGEKKYLLAARNLMDQLYDQPRCLESRVFWHKEIYPWQIWLDGLYMQSPFRAEYALLEGDDDLFDDVVMQLERTFHIMRDGKTGLLYHCFDESRGMKWSNDNTGLSLNFWLRSIGWYAMAVADVLDYLPAGHGKRDLLISIYCSIMEAICKYQDTSGMWYQVPDQGDREGNYLETSGTSMFAYCLFKGARLGYLEDKAGAIEKGRMALDGIRSRYLREDEEGVLHLGGICSVAGLGGNPYRDGSFAYYMSEKVVEDDFKGVGPFLLALIEEERSDTI